MNVPSDLAGRKCKKSRLAGHWLLSLRFFSAICLLALFSSGAQADDVVTNVMSQVVSYQFNDSLAENTNSPVVSPVVSYQFYDSLREDTNAIITSLIVSFQFFDTLASPGTNSLIMSPVASYQYFDWPDATEVHFLNSQPASFYYQFNSEIMPVFLHGRVTDVNGTAISGVTVSAKVLMSLAAQATSDAAGNYQMPSLGAGVYNLFAGDATHQTSMRGLTLNAYTARQDFQLKPLPPPPATQPTTRQPLASFTQVPSGPMGSSLKIFSGTAFTEITASNRPSNQLMTIVLTHGWVPTWPITGIPVFTPNGIDSWPASMAALLLSNGITAADANIVGWDWRLAATGPLPIPSGPVDLTPDQGVALGEALTNYLGIGYSQPVHFIGHSLGTLVNAAAANFLHGDANGNARRPVSSTPWQCPMQITLFDQAKKAEYFGVEAGKADLRLDFYSAEVNRQSPLPNQFTWADNYESLVGARLPGAVNIRLQKAPDFLLNHSYPMDWYSASIVNPTDPKDPLGFQNSYEFDNKHHLSFLAPNIFETGSIYHQVPINSDELALEPASDFGDSIDILPDYVITGGQNLLRGAVQFSGQVLVNVETAAQGTAQAALQGFNYVGGVAANGEHAVVNYFSSAVLHLTLRTSPASPGKNNLPHPFGLDGTTSNTPPMAWLAITIPPTATAMAFDFIVSGDPVDDALVCGIGDTNLFTIKAKYIPTNTISASRLMDVSAWAGTTNELFFGLLCGTSTNATLEIENIRFYSLQPPRLQITANGGVTQLTWPGNAAGYVVESTPSLSAPAWQTVTNAPAILNDNYVLTNNWNDQTRFFRLRSR